MIIPYNNKVINRLYYLIWYDHSLTFRLLFVSEYGIISISHFLKFMNCLLVVEPPFNHLHGAMEKYNRDSDGPESPGLLSPIQQAVRHVLTEDLAHVIQGHILQRIIEHLRPVDLLARIDLGVPMSYKLVSLVWYPECCFYRASVFRKYLKDWKI